MDTSERQRSIQANSFGAAAGAYERGRPSYPAEAVAWLMPPGARRVLDLGAGTGKLTRQLVSGGDAGLDVVAVEPSEGMREQLSRSLPGVPVLAGTAERIPLENGRLDAVLVAQAWHWVDPARAVPEVARVLKPGGSLGLLWNVRDEREGWVAELGAIMHQRGEAAADMRTADPTIGLPFGPVQRFDTAWGYRLTPATLLDLVASRSYVITLPEDERAALLADVRRLLANHPALVGQDTFVLPYVTRCSCTRLSDTRHRSLEG